MADQTIAGTTDLFEMIRTTRSMRRLKPDPDLGFVDLSGRSEHAARGAGARPRGDVDDALSELREGSRGRSRIAGRLAFLCSAADRLSVGSVRAGSPRRARRCRL